MCLIECLFRQAQYIFMMISGLFISVRLLFSDILLWQRCGLCIWKENMKSQVQYDRCRNFVCKDHAKREFKRLK